MAALVNDELSSDDTLLLHLISKVTSLKTVLNFCSKIRVLALILFSISIKLVSMMVSKPCRKSVKKETLELYHPMTMTKFRCLSLLPFYLLFLDNNTIIVHNKGIAQII